MKKFYLIIIAILILPAANLSAQKVYNGEIRVIDPVSKKTGSTVAINARLDLSALTLHRQQMVMITPILKSYDGTHRIVFDPVLVSGCTRLKALGRETGLHNYAFERKPGEIVRADKHMEQFLDLSYEVPFEKWMYEAELVLEEEATGCAHELLDQNTRRLIAQVLPPVVTPTYDVAYVTPPVEEIKQRSESYAARVNFLVNRFEIRRDYMNNAQVLSEVDQIIDELKNDRNLTITNFAVVGYASPEGNYQSNMKLSENRARSFVTYVRQRLPISENGIRVDWKGEDWDGLRAQMQDSQLPQRQQVTDIIDNNDIAQRKSKLAAMGQPYRELLSDYYPQLRRNEYTISYIARPFSIDEAKELVKTKPQHLSLNEMFLVANSYPKESQQFKEVFDIAVRLFPDSPYANVNSAALDIENGSYDVALGRLAKVDTPEAWNNTGIAYIHKGDYQKAKEYLRRAAGAGNGDARGNLAKLEEWLSNWE